ERRRLPLASPVVSSLIRQSFLTCELSRPPIGPSHPRPQLLGFVRVLFLHRPMMCNPLLHQASLVVQGFPELEPVRLPRRARELLGTFSGPRACRRRVSCLCR